jgi:hypothetical protein
MDLEAIHVTDDQEPRVLQGFPVQQQLLVGLRQAAFLALVFPGEPAAHPHVRPPFAAAGLVDAALERIPSALRIGRRRLVLIQQVAQVQKVLLGGAALRQLHLFPLGNEILRSHESLATNGVDWLFYPSRIRPNSSAMASVSPVKPRRKSRETSPNALDRTKGHYVQIK